MEQFSERVKEALQRAGTSESKLAKELGVSQSALNKAINRNSRTYHLIPEMAKILCVPEDWLRNGGPVPWKSDLYPEWSPDAKKVRETHSGRVYYASDAEMDEEIENLRRSLIVVAESYLDLADLAKKHGAEVSDRRINKIKEILDSL